MWLRVCELEKNKSWIIIRRELGIIFYSVYSYSSFSCYFYNYFPSYFFRYWEYWKLNIEYFWFIHSPSRSVRLSTNAFADLMLVRVAGTSLVSLQNSTSSENVMMLNRSFAARSSRIIFRESFTCRSLIPYMEALTSITNTMCLGAWGMFEGEKKWTK